MTPEKSGAHFAPGIRRIRGLDGIRGLAVAAVVAYHFFPHALPGGYVGVDMFFVLSGFLITALLVREKAATGTISLGGFWLRRARRILPAAVTVLLVMGAITGLVGGDPAVGLGTQITSSMLFMNNWVQIAGSHSYFADSGVQVFAHYWSLMVEEQFYFVWPLLFVAATAKKKMWPLGVVAAVGSVASALWMATVYNPEVDPTRVYYGTDTHCFGLLIGAALALAVTSTSDPRESFPNARTVLSNRWVAGVVGLVALGGLVAVWAVMSDTLAVTYRGGLYGASVVTAVLIAATLPATSPVGSLLAIQPLRWLGRRSFSLYLWHWPIIVLLRAVAARNHLEVADWVLGVVALVVSLPVAHWSFVAIEEPFHRKGYIATVKDSVKKAVNGSSGSMMKLVAVLVAVGVVVSAAIAAIATAPKQTELEADLAALQQQASAAPPAPPTSEAPPTTTDTKPVKALPPGNQITGIGDSVMLASLQALQAQFPGIHVDAKVSRAMVSTTPVIQALKNQGLLRRVIVLGFGTNSPLGADVIDKTIAQLGPDHIIIMTLPYGDRWWIPKAQASIRDAATRYPNVYVADWCDAARVNHQLLRTDMIHPTLEGASAYSQAILDALVQWRDGEKKIPAACGL